MLTLFVAVLLLVLAAFLEGAALQLLGFTTSEARLLEATVTLSGFVVLLLSVMSHKQSNLPPP